jgi:hypothetical protein
LLCCSWRRWGGGLGLCHLDHLIPESNTGGDIIKVT